MSEGDANTQKQSWLGWPRLYLDTGVLLAIADGRIDEPTLAPLLDALRERHTILVVSRDHMQDVIPRSDESTRDRFAAAVERFPFRAIVDREPHEIEPWPDGEQDIGLRPIQDLLPLLSHPAARPRLNELAAAQEHLHAATVASHASRPKSLALSAQARDLGLQCLVTLASGWMGTNVPEILAMWEAEKESSLSDAERSLIIECLSPWAALLAQVEQRYSPSAEDRGKLLRGLRDSFDDFSYVDSPGLFLGSRTTTTSGRTGA